MDVFTRRAFHGNPLAVVLDAQALGGDAMQRIASEFNYSETTFVLPPADPQDTAQVRIFTPRVEVPFAGHPNVGTAFALAQLPEWSAQCASGDLVFEEAAGRVPIRLLREGGAVVGAEFQAPEALSRRSVVAVARVAACLSLPPGAIRCATHDPQVVSVGLPFVVVELESRAALGAAKPNVAEFAALLPLDGADAIYAYYRDGALDTHIHARMFSPLDNIVEDPATGSATAAAAALIAQLEGRHELTLQMLQGEDMGRPSELFARVDTVSTTATSAHVGGYCVAVMEGTILTD